MLEETDWFLTAKAIAATSNNPHQVGCIIVRDGAVISAATNTHEGYECKRAGYPTGEGYDLCEGCQYDNHAEAKAIKDIDVTNADLYMVGHYYMCEPCAKVVKESGIADVYIWCDSLN